MKVKLRRARFGGMVAAGQIDTTARTGRPEAPEWAWVRAYKAGGMSEEEYTRRYTANLESVPVAHWRELRRRSRTQPASERAAPTGSVWSGARRQRNSQCSASLTVR